MSAATFTPGPWVAVGETVTASHPTNLDEAPVAHADGYWFPRQASANARLIAAAPELLEACKLAYARLKPGDIRKDYSGHIAHVAMAKAIAKAEGSAD